MYARLYPRNIKVLSSPDPLQLASQTSLLSRAARKNRPLIAGWPNRDKHKSLVPNFQPIQVKYDLLTMVNLSLYFAC